MQNTNFSADFLINRYKDNRVYMDRDRERAQARGTAKGKGKDDGLTPEQRRESDGKALQEKAAKKAAKGAGSGHSEGEEIISGAQRVHVPEFLAFESWLRGKALDPSKYKQHLGVIGKYRIANMTSLDSSLGPEIDLKVNVDISPDMKLEDLKLYDLIFFLVVLRF
ncbi:unnamed protein product [Camellia sinensis]